jgi:Domain of unknown function (DUF4926)
MVDDTIKLFDVVALLEDLPDEGLQRGDMGTIVEILPPDAYEVEFANREGETICELGLRPEQFVVLRKYGEPLSRRPAA